MNNPEVKRTQAKERMRRWRLTHPDRDRTKKRELDKAYRKKDPEAYRARQRTAYAAHAAERIAQVHAYQNANPEKIKAYRAANREKRAAQAAAWRVAHPEQVKANRRKHYDANADAARAYSREHHQKNRAKRLAYLEAWRKAHPDRVAAQWARKAIRRRVREKLAYVETIDPQLIFDRDGGLCGICHLPVERTKMTLDHIKSLARGGRHTAVNVQLAHRLCNSIKGTN